MIKFVKCGPIKAAKENSGYGSWCGFKQLHIGFGAKDGDYLVVCMRGAVGKRCQHVRMTEDEAEWYFKTGLDLLNERVKKHQEEDKKKEPTKEEMLRDELAERRRSAERERTREARKISKKLWEEITAPKMNTKNTGAQKRRK